MGTDRPGDPDMPPDDHPDRRDDQDGTGDRAARAGNAQAETRTRQEYYADLRVTVSKEESAVARQVTAEEQAAAEDWQGKAAESRWMWSEYQRKWPPAERPAVDRSTGQLGSCRGDSNRLLDPPTTAELTHSVTASPSGRRRRSHLHCAPSKAMIQTAT